MERNLYSSSFILCNYLTQKDDPNIHSKGIKDTNCFFGNFFLQSLKSCPTLCDPMDCSTPGFPVLHHLPELAQTHAHWVGDAIQPSHPLSSPSPLALISFPASRSFLMNQLFASGSQSIGVSASVLTMNTQDWSPCSPRESQESSPTPQFKSINSLALSPLNGYGLF